MKFKIESYTIEIRSRGFSAGNDGDYYNENVERFRILLDEVMIIDNLPYKLWAERYVNSFKDSMETSTSKRKAQLMKHFNKEQLIRKKNFEKSLKIWGKKRQQRLDLLKSKKL